MNKKAF